MARQENIEKAKDIEKAKRTKLIKHIYIYIYIEVIMFFLGGQGVG